MYANSQENKLLAVIHELVLPYRHGTVLLGRFPESFYDLGSPGGRSGWSSRMRLCGMSEYAVDVQTVVENEDLAEVKLTERMPVQLRLL